MNLVSNKTKVKCEINTLIRHTKDAVEGYEKAADRIEDTHGTLAAEWRALAASRSAQADRLNQRLDCIGETETSRGAMEGAMHRGLISVKEMFASDDLESVIDEVIRSEEKLVAYIDEMFADLDVVDGETRRVVNELRAHVEGSLDILRRHRSR